MNDLVPRPSPLGSTFDVARRLAEAAEHPPFHRDLLFGTRGIKRPFVALTTKQEMGPCRHALSQMVVAGVMTVHHAPGAAARAPGAPATEPQVLTFTPPPPRDAESTAPGVLSPPVGPPRPAVPTAPARVVAPAGPAIRASQPPNPPPRQVRRPEPTPTTRAPGDRVVTIERHTVEDFNPLSNKDE